MYFFVLLLIHLLLPVILGYNSLLGCSLISAPAVFLNFAFLLPLQCVRSAPFATVISYLGIVL